MNMQELEKLEKQWIWYKLKNIVIFILLLIVCFIIAVLIDYIISPKISQNKINKHELHIVEKIVYKDKVIYKDKIIYRDKIVYKQQTFNTKVLALDMSFLENIQQNVNLYATWVSFSNKKYKKSCINMGKYVAANYSLSIKDENILSFYAYSCLQAGYISMLKTPIIKLNHSVEARLNAAYFATVFYLKKLIYPMILDGVDMSGVSIPKIDNFLSYIFEALKTKRYTVINDRIIVKVKSKVYKIYRKRYKQKNTLEIEIYEEDKLIKTRRIY